MEKKNRFVQMAVIVFAGKLFLLCAEASPDGSSSSLAFFHDGFWGSESVGSSWLAWVYLRRKDCPGNHGLWKTGDFVLPVQHSPTGSVLHTGDPAFGDSGIPGLFFYA